MARAPNQNFATPGVRKEPAAAPVAPPAPVAVPAPEEDADLEAYASDDLPPVAAGEAQLLLAQQQATIAAMKRRLDSIEKTKVDKPGKPQPETFTMEEAKRLAEEDVKNGRRPRSRLTAEGWYVHPEMARISRNI